MSGEDLTAATEYMLDSAGRPSAKRFLDRYSEMRLLPSAFPFHGPLVGAEGLRWREPKPFTAVYEIDEEHRRVTLLGCIIGLRTGERYIEGMVRTLWAPR